MVMLFLEFFAARHMLLMFYGEYLFMFRCFQALSFFHAGVELLIGVFFFFFFFASSTIPLQFAVIM